MYPPDCPLFNSGKGAVFNVDGKNELEASLMLSKPPASHPALPASRRGIGLTILTQSRNPSHLARTLFLAPGVVPHATLSGHTAESIGESLGLELVDPSYFYTEARWKEHRRGLGLPNEPFPPGHSPSQPPIDFPLDQMPGGTVGAVALDMRGCIATVTSTGGKTNKLVGRIGDTPHMGCGFWAEEWKDTGLWSRITGKNKRAVGVSGTGDGDVSGWILNSTCTVDSVVCSILLEKQPHPALHIG
jgi:L-asparaginase / beta-aspartyl-peptidase